MRGTTTGTVAIRGAARFGLLISLVLVFALFSLLTPSFLTPAMCRASSSTMLHCSPSSQSP
jgi:hypothetical protein